MGNPLSRDGQPKCGYFSDKKKITFFVLDQKSVQICLTFSILWVVGPIEIEGVCKAES